MCHYCMLQSHAPRVTACGVCNVVRCITAAAMPYDAELDVHGAMRTYEWHRSAPTQKESRERWYL